MSKPLYPESIPRRAFDYTDSILHGLIPDESELSAGIKIVPGRTYGFFTDTSLCIGCKACEVACKEWNALPADGVDLSGLSYDNTRSLSATTWRHVLFIERIGESGGRATLLKPFQSHWLMMSDVCKHCKRAACLEACPTGALFRTEFGTVVVQQDICNGCAYCVPACPFGVVELNTADGKAHKCTLCYDRLKGGLEPACAKTCPTNSIQFGEVGDLKARAYERLKDLRKMGRKDAYLYGTPGSPGATGGIEELNAFFLLLDRPETYNLPVSPHLPSAKVRPSLVSGAAVMAGLVLASWALLRTSTLRPRTAPYPTKERESLAPLEEEKTLDSGGTRW
ncbi:MAG: 4Fe-4S dicluster domain-containing protein [Desulfobacteraceae bacterium]|nr:MAG: 4Fe-4S dicluster domain-containing protein [Desulfobacteraceae bacterium]